MKQFLLFTLAGLAMATSSRVFASITTVTPSNMDGWSFYTTDNNFTVGPGSGTYGIVTGPASPPLGIGSANMATATNHGDEEVQLRNTDWAGTKVGEVSSLSYSTYATAWNGQQDTFFDIYINTDGDVNGGYNDRLIFEPDYGSVDFVPGGPPAPVLNQWQTWNLLDGRWYDDLGNGGNGGSNAISWGDFLALFPNAVIVNDDGNNDIGGLRLAIGAGSATDNFDASVDNFTIGVAGVNTTYDFEPDSNGAVPEAPALAIWGMLGLVTGGGYLLHLNRKACE